MKIERISDNQIRCTLNHEDLTSRDLDLRELAYGSDRARGLFHEMIEQAFDEVGFEAEDIPLMIEAIPMSYDSLILLITKVPNPEELDTRFARFSPSDVDELEAEPSQMTASVLEEPAKATGAKTDNPEYRIFSFKTLDDVSLAADAVKDVVCHTNSLFKKDKHYYLLIQMSNTQSADDYRICNILGEYGTRLPASYAAAAYFEEHYEPIVLDNALEVFKNL